MEFGEQFLKSARKLTDTTKKIPDIEIKENLSRFLMVLEAVIEPIEEKKLDSKTLLKTILIDPELYTGIELTLHSVCTAAVKVSVESFVESQLSRYEGHFDLVG